MGRKSEDFWNECKLVKQGTESESCPIALSQLLKWVKVFPSSGLPSFFHEKRSEWAKPDRYSWLESPLFLFIKNSIILIITLSRAIQKESLLTIFGIWTYAPFLRDHSSPYACMKRSNPIKARSSAGKTLKEDLERANRGLTPPSINCDVR